VTEHANGGSFACSVDIDAPAQTTENSTAEINSEPAIASGFARFGFGPELLKAIRSPHQFRRPPSLS
jgi:ATP-dependent RNA helicase DeaD